MECTLNPQEWGWKLDEEKFMPIMTDKAPAPDKLLNMIRCNCQVTSKNPCGGHTQCSCRKNGLKCVAACGDCRGMECQNCDTVELASDDESEEYDNNIFENIFGV